MWKYQYILFHIVKQLSKQLLNKYGNKYSAHECMYNQGVPAMTVTS